MRLGKEGYPLVILSHRGQEFIDRTMASLRVNGHGITDVVVVDDSGNRAHHEWLDRHGYQFSVVQGSGNAGYLTAMNRVWEVAAHLADWWDTEYVMLWEEDFRLTRSLSLFDMATVMEENPMLAQLNAQRQAVYRVERLHGYMESHQRRGYGLTRETTAGLDWVSRRTPFTTNPSLLRREVLDVPWPDRQQADSVSGGAEPAMSLQLEAKGWYFGWFGRWNSRHTLHVGAAHKSGVGY